jgi:transposase
MGAVPPRLLAYPPKGVFRSIITHEQVPAGMPFPKGLYMKNAAKKLSHLQPIPLLKQEALYIGIDIGKMRHVAGFVSLTLLERHQRFEACPALAFENSRDGFHTLLERIRALAPLEHCFVLLEKTGHYHKALVQYLQELDIPIYLMHVQERPQGMMKTDKRDALNLANTLYNQLALGVQVRDKTQLVRRAVPPTPAAAQLKGFIRHRYELVREATQRKNKLIAICDELFPEFTRILHDPTGPTALALRGRFPTPAALATASLSVLEEVRGKARCISNAKLLELQRLAAESIGTKDIVRQRGLVLEQAQLMQELRLLQEHIDQLENEITSVVTQAREGRILQSLGIGPIQAATIIAVIGSIENFPNAGSLKSYFGWSPTVIQSGSTVDYVGQTHGGTRPMKQMMFLIVSNLINRDTEWARLYERLVKAKCPYDERTGQRKGKLRVIGRVAGQLIETMYALLKTDAEAVSKVLPNETLPEPVLYDPEKRRQHREGHYQPLKMSTRRSVLTLLPHPS